MLEGQGLGIGVMDLSKVTFENRYRDETDEMSIGAEAKDLKYWT